MAEPSTPKQPEPPAPTPKPQEAPQRKPQELPDDLPGRENQPVAEPHAGPDQATAATMLRD